MNTQIQQTENQTGTVMVNGSLDGAALADYIRLNWRDIVEAMDVKERSKATYKGNIKPFLEWLNVVNINTVRNYKAHVMQLDASPSYKRDLIVIVKKLFKELNVHYRILPFDIGQGVKAPSVSNEHTKAGVTNDEAQRIAAYIDSQPAPKRSRLNAMFHLYAFQALRSKEVVLLRVEDIDFVGCTALVDGKTGANQTIHLLPVTVKALRAYIDEHGLKSGYLFRNRSNSAKGNVPISTRSVRRIFTNIFKELDINRTVHGFRHFCITRLIELGFAFDEVMRYARIKDVNTIKKYNDRVNSEQTAQRIAAKFTL